MKWNEKEKPSLIHFLHKTGARYTFIIQISKFIENKLYSYTLNLYIYLGSENKLLNSKLVENVYLETTYWRFGYDYIVCLFYSDIVILGTCLFDS